MKLSVLMPVYNEKSTIREIVWRVLSQDVPGISSLELVIVDDCSKDGSRDIAGELALKHSEIKLVLHNVNSGKGSSICSAIAHATGDIAIIQDADLEYDPGDYKIVLKPILERNADVVYGSRFANLGVQRLPYCKFIYGNKLLTFLSNLFTGLHLTDVETCYKVFRMDVLKSIPIRSSCFGIEPEITAKIARRKLRIVEVPINYRGRTDEEGKKIKWTDGVRALWIIIKYWIIDDSQYKNYEFLAKGGCQPNIEGNVN